MSVPWFTYLCWLIVLKSECTYLPCCLIVLGRGGPWFTYLWCVCILPTECWRKCDAMTQTDDLINFRTMTAVRRNWWYKYRTSFVFAFSKEKNKKDLKFDCDNNASLEFGGVVSVPVWPVGQFMWLWAIYVTLGNFSKFLAANKLPKSPTFLGNFCKGVKS